MQDLLNSLDAPDAAIDQQWATEAEDRLAAYERGEIPTVELADVLAKYRLQ